VNELPVCVGEVDNHALDRTRPRLPAP
jgi:hypothetical protein